MHCSAFVNHLEKHNVPQLNQKRESLNQARAAERRMNMESLVYEEQESKDECEQEVTGQEDDEDEKFDEEQPYDIDKETQRA